MIAMPLSFMNVIDLGQARAAGSSSSIEMKTMIPATPARMQPIMTGDMNGMRIK